jgi:hypothetical protein
MRIRPSTRLTVVLAESMLSPSRMWTWIIAAPAARAAAPFRRSAAGLSMATLNLAGRALRREAAFPGLRALIGAAHRAVREGGPPPVPPEEIVEAAELMERINNAART